MVAVVFVGPVGGVDDVGIRGGGRQRMVFDIDATTSAKEARLSSPFAPWRQNIGCRALLGPNRPHRHRRRTHLQPKHAAHSEGCLRVPQTSQEPNLPA